MTKCPDRCNVDKTASERESINVENTRQPDLKAVLFDFGGVLAEEGFREGLKSIARCEGHDPDKFFDTAADAAYSTGYVIGRTDEHEYWEFLRRTAGIRGSEEELRHDILSRFILRPWMLNLVESVRKKVDIVAILSDQSNWLDELEREYVFFRKFDRVFNSYHLGKGKKDATIFTDITAELGVKPSEALFIDDNEGHVRRAREKGLHAVLFRDRGDLEARLLDYGLLDPDELEPR